MNHDTLQIVNQHQQILLLLPWYLNQSLEFAEQQQVESHIRTCMLCRRELVHLRKLSTAVRQESDLDVAAEASFHALKAKLHTVRQQPPESVVPQSVNRLAGHNNVDAGLSFRCATDSRQRLWSYLGSRGVQLAIAASLLMAIIPLVMQEGRAPATAEYYTLSDSKPESSTAPQLRVVFKNSISNADLNAFLAQIHGRRIEGPNSIGAYTVQLESAKDSPKLAAAIAFLRQQPNVMLAEPVFQP